VTLVNRMVDARPCNVIDILRHVRNRRTIIIIIIIKDRAASSSIAADCLLRKIVTEVRFPELLLLLWHHRDDVMRWVDDNIYTPLADII